MSDRKIAQSDWRLNRLGDVAELQSGVAKSPYMPADPVVRPYLRVANVQDGRLDLTEVKTIAVDRRNVARFELRVGDVLMTEGGDFDKLGRGTVWRGELPGCLHQNHVFALRPDPERLLPEFLAAWTTSRAGRKFFLSCSKQTTNLASINASQVKGAKLLLPPVREQERILEALAPWDRSLRALDALLQQKRRLKRGLMQQILTGRRRLAALRDPWPTVKLSRVLRESRETASTGAHARRISIKLYAKGAEANDSDRPGSARTQYYKRRSGQLVYSKLDFLNGAVAIVPPELDGYESTLDLPAFDVSPQANASLVWRLLSSPDFYRRQVRIAHGGRKARRVNPRHLLALEVRLPSRREQDSIVSCLDCLDREIRLVANQRELVATQRSALMDRLLTGKLRLTV